MRQSRSTFTSTAEHREPCEPRGSSTVLGAPGGETPPGDSPADQGIPRLACNPDLNHALGCYQVYLK